MNNKKSEDDTNHIVGIDFGTSWTSAMSNKGDRVRFRSIVGYPKDILARSIINDEFLMGEKALEKSGSLNLCYPLKDGVIDGADEQNIEAASEILTFAVSETNPGPRDRICCIIGVPSKALAKDKERLLSIAKEASHYAAVVSEPFLVGFGLDKLMNTIVVDIGAGTTDICGLKGGIPTPEDEIMLLKAGASIDDALKKAINDKYPGLSLTTHLIQKIKEEHAFVGPASKKVIVELREKGIPGKYDITAQVKSACETVLPDMVESIIAMVSTFDLESQDEVLQNIYLTGGGSLIKGIDTYIKKELEDYGDIKIHLVQDTSFAGCEGALKISDSVLLNLWQELGTVSE
jgi:rod shape-determining protein MreB